LVSVFDKVADVVTGHPRVIIALWMLVLIISLPFAGMFSANLQYDIQKFIPGNIGAMMAKEKYDEQSLKAIDSIQEKLRAYESGRPGATLLLTGNNVGAYEYPQLCTGNEMFVLPAVLIGIFIVLVLLLRSLFTPARLILTLIMSVVWTLAALILVFQNWLQDTVSWMLPIMMFCVLMGLGVDYDIFLVSRIREEVFKGLSEEGAITQAIESTGTIITLCGAVMTVTYGAMMLSGLTMNMEIGFAFCLAIILDSTIMRLIIVPAIMVQMKKYNWWMPGKKVRSEVPGDATVEQQQQTEK